MSRSELPVSSPDSLAYRLLQDSDWAHGGLAEAAPDELRTVLTMILDCPEPLWISWGPDNLFYFNDAFSPWMGNKLVGAMATPVRIVWHDVWDELGGAIADAMAGTHRSFRNLRVFMDRDGTRRETFWTFSYSPIRVADGSVGGILCVVSDQTEFVSERNEHSRQVESISEEARQAHAELVRAREQLRQSQKLEAIGQLTGGVAHDFNNLLQVITGSVDMLRYGKPRDEQQRRHIEAIGAAADRATNLVSHLLSFSRRQTLSPEVFDLGKGVEGLADIIRTLLGSRVALQLDLPDDPLHVLLDKTQLDTALINLAVNARDAIGKNGTVRICVRRVDTMPSVRFAPPLKGAFAAVSVSDDGCGIEEAVLSQVFDPFFTTKGVGEGTGLGLSQVFGFVKQSEGEVDVTSTVGEGSTFVLYLPLTDQEPVSMEGSSLHALQEAKGLNVLVVEDNVDVAAFAVSALRELGCGVQLARNGAEALADLERHHARYDVVFSDVVMPGITGLELARTVQATYPGLHVVLTSGYSELLARETDHGFVVLRKPYTLGGLAEAIKPPVGAGEAVEELGSDDRVWRTVS
ncbi:ATP-binding protein [Stenotrophomonas sp.]|uniref:ATP-binding protein n=1 Tax=Stenotrophomonas sp. TaxID=69392 RepID=UPI00289C71E6|nr:ATP-binding protein [Stenotrophomonas sp.]